MAWQDVVLETGVVSPNKTTWQLLLPNEGMHINIFRTGGGAVDVVINVWSSIDASLEPHVPIFSFTIDALDDHVEIPISGPLFSIACSSNSGTFAYRFRTNGGLA